MSKKLKTKAGTKIKYWLFYLFLIGITVSVIIWWKQVVSIVQPLSEYLFKQKTVYIAVSGPMTGNGQANGDAMLEGIQLYLDKINQAGGIHKKKVELLVFDDQNQADLAKQNALEITQNQEILGVIGHYTSTASLAAAPIYQKNEMPVITASATTDELTEGNDWYFRTVPTNSDQSALLVNYIYKILGHESVYILYDNTAYGMSLRKAFLNTAKEVGLSVNKQWQFYADSSSDLNKTIDQMVTTFQAKSGEKAALFLATHSSKAIKVITTLKNEKVAHVTMLGADSLVNNYFMQKMSQYPEEATQPGYYTDGLYATAPFLIDAANQETYIFHQKFVEKYEKEPSVISALYYDAAMVLLNAMKQALPQDNLVSNYVKIKSQMKKHLWSLSKPDNAINGITGYFYFDDNGNAVRSIPMAVYKRGKPTAAMYQYQLLQDLQETGDVLTDYLTKKLVIINDKFMTLARVVHVGLDFISVSELNLKNLTFNADFYLWFRFKGEFDDQNIIFSNILNAGNNPLKSPILEWHSPSEPDVTTKTYRINERFKVEFNFADYPLDLQDLPIRFRHSLLTSNNLIYAVDIAGMNAGKIHSKKDLKEYENNFFELGGWYLRKLTFFQGTQTSNSTLGVTDLIGNQRRIEYSTFNASINIARQVISLILKSFLPAIFLVILGYAAFYINAYDKKLALGTNLILATSLFHLRFSSDLPKVDQIILIEYFFYLVYLLAIFIIILSILIHLRGLAQEKLGDDADMSHWDFVYRLNNFGKIFYPLIIISFIAFVAYQQQYILLNS